MAKKLGIYKCEACGNIVEVVHQGGGTLVCCNAPMSVMKEQTADSSTEKHVPVVTNEDGKIRVFVGSTEHPMTDAHYIEWIEILADNKVYRKFLNPGEKPEAIFNIKAEKVIAREYCNVHGLWSTEE